MQHWKAIEDLTNIPEGAILRRNLETDQTEMFDKCMGLDEYTDMMFSYLVETEFDIVSYSDWASTIAQEYHVADWQHGANVAVQRYMSGERADGTMYDPRFPEHDLLGDNQALDSDPYDVEPPQWYSSCDK